MTAHAQAAALARRRHQAMMTARLRYGDMDPRSLAARDAFLRARRNLHAQQDLRRPVGQASGKAPRRNYGAGSARTREPIRYPKPGSALRYDARYGTVLEPVTVLAHRLRPRNVYDVRYADGEVRTGVPADYVTLRSGSARTRPADQTRRWWKAAGYGRTPAWWTMIPGSGGQGMLVLKRGDGWYVDGTRGPYPTREAAARARLAGRSRRRRR